MADTYSFDVVSDFDRQELVNTLDQVRRDVGQRFDLKDSGTEIDLEETSLTITTASDMTLQAVEDVLRQKATKRNLSLKIFDFQTPEAVGGNKVKQVVKLRKGLSQELAKKLSKTVRDELKKVTVAIQGESLRVTGKNKDDLQQAIQLLKEQDVDVPLQFENYRFARLPLEFLAGSGRHLHRCGGLLPLRRPCRAQGALRAAGQPGGSGRCRDPIHPGNPCRPAHTGWFG